jgi:hypothetical protein
VANERSIALVISDIERDNDEPGDRLPERLGTLGINTPIVFYVGSLDPERGPPPGAASIQDGPALLVRDVLNLLSQSP